MPYSRNIDLPAKVMQNLPQPAQDTYRQAYNKAWNNYQRDEKRDGNMSLEDVAHLVAWASLEENFHRTKGRWVPD